MNGFDLSSQLDARIVGGLRAIYAAPAEGAYWNDLEAMVMARVAAVDMGWWTEFDRWAKPLLAAAAVLVTVAGLTMHRSMQFDRDRAYHQAYEELFSPSATGVPMAPRPTLESPRDAMLRHLLTR